jgi:hypothetical protein
MFKSRKISWAGHVACMSGEEECKYSFDMKARRKEATGKA